MSAREVERSETRVVNACIDDPKPMDGRSARRGPVREVFGAARDAEGALFSLRAERQHLQETLYGIPGAPDGERVRSGGTSSPVERATVSLDEVDQRLGWEQQRYARAVAQAEEIIRRIRREDYRTVLRLRYLAGLRWDDVAQAMGFAETSSAHRVHRRAMEVAEKLSAELEW